MDHQNSQNSNHYPSPFGSPNSSASWMTPNNPDVPQFSQALPEYTQLTVVTNANMHSHSGMSQVNQTMSQSQESPDQNWPRIDSLSILSPNRQIQTSQPLHHTSASRPEVSPSHGSPEWYPQGWTYNQAPQNISPPPYPQQQGASQAYPQTYAIDPLPQNFVHPPVSRQTSLLTSPSKKELGGVKTRISKKKSAKVQPSLVDPSTSEKRPPGRPRKTDFHQLDLTKKDDKELLRKRRYAQRYREKEKQTMQMLEKKLDKVEIFMKNLIQNYGEACRPMFTDFWNSYKDDDEDDSLCGQNRERFFSEQQCSPWSI